MGSRWMEKIGTIRPLASDALQRCCNAILRNCNAIFDFQITLFYVFCNLIFCCIVSVRALFANIPLVAFPNRICFVNDRQTSLNGRFDVCLKSKRWT